MFGNPETTPGGRALKFYSTVRLEVRRSEQIKDGSDVIGNRTKIKVVKNKVAPPFKVALVDIMYGHGISQTGELVDMAVEKDIVNKSGSWYSYKDERIGQGRENAKKFLADNPEKMEEIRQRVRDAYNMDGKSDEDKKSDKKDEKSDDKSTAKATGKKADATDLKLDVDGSKSTKPEEKETK